VDQFVVDCKAIDRACAFYMERRDYRGPPGEVDRNGLPLAPRINPHLDSDDVCRVPADVVLGPSTDVDNHELPYAPNITNQHLESDDVGTYGPAECNHEDILARRFDGDVETIDDAFNSVHPFVRTGCRLSCLFKDKVTRAKCLQLVREEWSSEVCMSYWIDRICECCNSFSVAQQIEAFVRDLVYSQIDSVEQLISRYKTLSLDFDLVDNEDDDPGDSTNVCANCFMELDIDSVSGKFYCGACGIFALRFYHGLSDDDVCAHYSDSLGSSGFAAQPQTGLLSTIAEGEDFVAQESPPAPSINPHLGSDDDCRVSADVLQEGSVFDDVAYAEDLWICEQCDTENCFVLCETCGFAPLTNGQFDVADKSRPHISLPWQDHSVDADPLLLLSQAPIEREGRGQGRLFQLGLVLESPCRHISSANCAPSLTCGFCMVRFIYGVQRPMTSDERTHYCQAMDQFGCHSFKGYDEGRL